MTKMTLKYSRLQVRVDDHEISRLMTKASLEHSRLKDKIEIVIIRSVVL